MRSSPTACRPFHRSRTACSSSAIEETPHINGRRIFPEVHRLDGGQDAHLRCDLQHGSARDSADHGRQSGWRHALHLNAQFPRAIG